MNSVVDKENSDYNLDRLGAQRYLYSLSKRLFAIQVLLTVFVVVFLSLLAYLLKIKTFVTALGFPETYDISTYVAAYGIILTAVDMIILAPIVNKYREKAAKIQEAFDCDVLKLPWNPVIVGERPDDEDVHVYSQKYKHGDPDCHAIRDWYSRGVARLSIEQARIACQRSNLRWDVELRRRYRFAALVTAVVLFVILLLFAVSVDFSCSTLVSLVFAPFLPAFVLFTRTANEHGQTIEQLRTLKSYLDSTWNRLLTHPLPAEEGLTLSRCIQDGLYVHRASAPLIFDWVYWLLRSNSESSMNYAVGRLVDVIEERESQEPLTQKD